MDRLMNALMSGLRYGGLDYEIIESYTDNGDNIAWVEVDGEKFSVIVRERE